MAFVMDRWKCRVALVTGASMGIGAAISRALVKEGVIVVGAARSLDKMEKLRDELVSDGTFFPVRCDLSKDEEIVNLFSVIKEKYGGVDICINNAALTFPTTLLEGSPSEWRTMCNVNMIALSHCTKLTYESMKERGVDDGHIIHICSDSGHIVEGGYSIYNFYAGTKFAVWALTEGLRKEFRELKSHIRISSISPGFVNTEIFDNLFNDKTVAEDMFSKMKPIEAHELAQIVINMLATPQHIQINNILVRPTEQD